MVPTSFSSLGDADQWLLILTGFYFVYCAKRLFAVLDVARNVDVMRIDFCTVWEQSDLLNHLGLMTRQSLLYGFCFCISHLADDSSIRLSISAYKLFIH